MNIIDFIKQNKDKFNPDERYFPRKMTQDSMTYFELLCMLSGIKYLPFMRIKTVFYNGRKLGIGSRGNSSNSTLNEKLFNKVYALRKPMDSVVRIKYHQSPRHNGFFYEGFNRIKLRGRYITLYID